MIEAVRNLHSLGVSNRRRARRGHGRALSIHRAPREGLVAGAAARRHPRRQPRGRPRPGRRRDRWRCLSPLHKEAAGELFSSEIREQPAAIARLLEESGGCTRPQAGSSRSSSRLSSASWTMAQSDNAACTASMPSACCPGTAMRDSMSLTIYYGATGDFERSAVVALSQSGQTPDVVEYVVQARKRGAPHDRAHERPLVWSWQVTRADIVRCRWRPARARCRGDEDLRQPARRARAASRLRRG